MTTIVVVAMRTIMPTVHPTSRTFPGRAITRDRTPRERTSRLFVASEEETAAIGTPIERQGELLF
jgi:hypothetical protein